MHNDDRGQSELVGYALIFSVVVLMIALVGTAGFVGLDNAQDFQRTTNAEQGFTAFANNVDDILRRGAPSRTTEIRLADASLSLEQTTELTIMVDNGTTANTTVQIHSLVYDSGSGTRISYSSGAVIRQDERRSVMVRQPNVVLKNETVILPVIHTVAADNGTVGGTTGAEVETQSAGSEVVANDSVENVTIKTTSPHPDAWYRYLETETAANCNVPVNETVRCDVEPDQVYIAVERVDVRLQ
jgi:hypothetical protein